MKIKNQDQEAASKGSARPGDSGDERHTTTAEGHDVQVTARRQGGRGEVATTGEQAVRGRVRRGRRRAFWWGVLVTLVAVILLEQAAWAYAATGGIAEVKSFASKLTGYVTAVAASVAILFMAVNGLRWTMSSGNPMRQAEARNGLVAAAAGLAIALSAGVIVNLVIAALQ